MLFLLVSNSCDLTTDLVVEQLHRSHFPYVRLNCDQIEAGQPTLDFESKRPFFEFINKRAIVSLSDVTAAYLRRPNLDIDPNGLDARYRFSEWRAVLDAFYSELSGLWLNEPHIIDLAENKVRQLRAAKALDFDVPKTIVSSDPMKIREFAKRFSCIAKPLRNGVFHRKDEESIVFTTRIQDISHDDEQAIRAAPIIVQEEIKKEADVRVTVVGKKVFATAIDSQADEFACVDWRKGDISHLAHSPLDLPSAVRDRCVSLVSSLGLRFGAIDLVLDAKQRYWFLEINPNGQWGWIQIRTNQPIAQAIVQELAEISEK